MCPSKPVKIQRYLVIGVLFDVEGGSCAEVMRLPRCQDTKDLALIAPSNSRSRRSAVSTAGHLNQTWRLQSVPCPRWDGDDLLVVPGPIDASDIQK